MKDKKKIIIILISILVVLIIAITCYFIFFKKSFSNETKSVEENTTNETETVKENKITITDISSKTRPYAIVINNSPAAIKVQTGLNKALVIYEFPVEGGLSRLMGIYKDASDMTVGTIRSARHNFLDYAFEYDAILVHYGWSHYAKDDITNLKVNNVNGILDSAGFWRNNPENLASEHTAYTSMSKIASVVSNKGYKTTTDQGLVLGYSTTTLDLSSKDNSSVANTVYIPYGGYDTKFTYDKDKQVYNRYANGTLNVDHETKETFTTKNIIVEKINTGMASDNHYWNLTTTGSGKGFFITNGYAVPITWSKENRNAKTIYKYTDGSLVELNDGNTYIELQSNNQNLTIE